MRLGASNQSIQAEADSTAQKRGLEQEAEREADELTADAVLTASNPTDGNNAVSSGGSPLSAELRGYFEPRLGADLSEVRLHTGVAAATAAESMKTRAFAEGADITFGSGQFAPHTSAGLRLLAHELTHVRQAREGRVPPSGHRLDTAGPAVADPGLLRYPSYGPPIQDAPSYPQPDEEERSYIDAPEEEEAAEEEAQPATNPAPPHSDGNVLLGFFCLLRLAFMGLSPYERGAWILLSPAGYSLDYWPWSGGAGKEKFKGKIPAQAVAFAHTHPSEKSQQPSGGDRNEAGRLGMPLYVITGKALWMTNGATDTQVAESGWYKPYKKQKKTCPQS